MNTYLAVHSADDLQKKMKELESAWGHFVSEKQKPNSVRQKIYQSWRRCQKYKVDPLQKQAPIIIDDDYSLKESITKSKVYTASRPVIDSLNNQIKGTGHLITLADHQGRIIHLEGDHKIKSKAEKMSFVIGADWSEKAAGSNAIGTSLAVGHPIQIFSFEHFCEGVHPWICSAAPIKDPLTGKLLGVIDLTGPSHLTQPHSLSVVQNISNLIEQNIYSHSAKNRYFLNQYYQKFLGGRESDNLMLFDDMLNIIHAGPNCLSLLQIDHWRKISAHPELQHIKNSMISNNEQEWELEIPSLQLKVHVQTIIANSERIGFLLYLKKTKKIRGNTYWGQIIGKSSSIRQLITKAKTIASTDVPILLLGESGTGKEVISRAIHKESNRQHAPFVAINCGSIPKHLIASELFGYEAGAFTGGNPKGKPGKFEEADGGTLLLDEIGEMPLDLQVHLLRILQEKEVVRLGSSKPIPVDIRIIAATNRDIQKLISEGTFREDLYYRLNVVELHLPSLNERKEDIPLLTKHYINQFAMKYNKPLPRIEKDVLSFLTEYPWPGNIRELTNILEYAVLFCENNRITRDSLPDSLKKHGQQMPTCSLSLSPLEQEEKQKLSQLLIETEGNLSEVARRCRIARTTLYRKLKKYQLHIP